MTTGKVFSLVLGNVLRTFFLSPGGLSGLRSREGSPALRRGCAVVWCGVLCSGLGDWCAECSCVGGVPCRLEQQKGLCVHLWCDYGWGMSPWRCMGASELEGRGTAATRAGSGLEQQCQEGLPSPKVSPGKCGQILLSGGSSGASLWLA